MTLSFGRGCCAGVETWTNINKTKPELRACHPSVRRQSKGISGDYHSFSSSSSSPVPLLFLFFFLYFFFFVFIYLLIWDRVSPWLGTCQVGWSRLVTSTKDLLVSSTSVMGSQMYVTTPVFSTWCFACCVCVWRMCMPDSHRSAEGTGSLGSEVTDSCELPGGRWESNLCPPQE